MPNMVQCFVGNIMLVMHNSKPPNDAEWAEYMRGLRTMDEEQRLHYIQSIVFTEGGSPNSAQRKELNDFLLGRAIPGAVVSPSSIVRGVVTALSWFNPKIKAFSPDRVEDAFRYVGIRESQVDIVWREVENLRSRIGGDVLKSMAPKAPAAR